MAQEFNIPGLKEALTDISKMNDSVNKLAKDLLDSAINGEKLAKSFGGSKELKDYIELQKKANETQKETDALANKLIKKEKELSD